MRNTKRTTAIERIRDVIAFIGFALAIIGVAGFDSNIAVAIALIVVGGVMVLIGTYGRDYNIDEYEL